LNGNLALCALVKALRRQQKRKGNQGSRGPETEESGTRRKEGHWAEEITGMLFEDVGREQGDGKGKIPRGARRKSVLQASFIYRVVL